MRTFNFGNNEHKEYKIYNWFYLLRFKRGFWFRFFGGYGLHGKKFKGVDELLFSDRYHLSKRLIIGGWIFKILKPDKK